MLKIQVIEENPQYKFNIKLGEREGLISFKEEGSRERLFFSLGRKSSGKEGEGKREGRIDFFSLGKGVKA